MNHPLTEKILEEFEKEYEYCEETADKGAIIIEKITLFDCDMDKLKAFLRSAIQRTANEFRVEEKEIDLRKDDTLRYADVGHNQLARQQNAKIDDIDFEDEESDMECQTCAGEYPNDCICYVKGKRPVWIKI